MEQRQAKTVRPKTDKEVMAFAKANKGRRAELYVGGVGGLEARTTKSGELIFAVRYWDRSGVRRTMTLGPVTLGEARQKAADIVAEARVGTDPWEKKRAEKLASLEERRRTGRTIEKVVEEWLKSKEAEGWRAGTKREMERLLRKHLLPAFGTRDPNTIVRGEVRKMLDAIAEDAPSEANHCYGALRGLWNWLRKDRQEHFGITVNPLDGLEKPGGKQAPRDRVYTDDEIRAILGAVKGTDLDDLVTLLFHTGTRDTETRSMRWADVDFDRGVWTIPKERSKNKLDTTVVLSSGAVKVLKGRPRFGEFVFANPETKAGFVERPQKALRAASIKAGLLVNTAKEKEAPKWEGEGLRLHDIRRTVGDRIKGEFGAAYQHAALGHAEDMLTRIYGPTPPLKQMGRALEWWSDELNRILAGKPQEQEQQA